MASQDNPAVSNDVSKKKKKKDRTDESSQRPLQFGKLTERLELEMQKFQPASDALCNISNIMQQYRSEVEVVATNFGTLQAKDEEIKTLKALVRQWKSLRDDENDALKCEIKAIREDQERFGQEKQAFEQVRDENVQKHRRNQNELAKREKQLRDDHEERVEEAKIALKKQNQEILAQLRDAKEAMAEEISVLKAKIAQEDRTSKRKQADWDIVRNSLDAENQKVGAELKSLKRDFAIEDRPNEFYKDKFQGIQELVKETSSKFFSQLPKSPGAPKIPFESLSIPCRIAEFAFLSESQVSTNLRHSTVEFLIVDSLRKLIWQPFGPFFSPSETSSVALLQTMSGMSDLSDRAEATWRALTVHALKASSSQDGVHKHLTDSIIELLAPFTDQPANSSLKETVADIVQKAVDVWDVSQRDACQVQIQYVPMPDDKIGWIREDGDLFEDSHDCVNEDLEAAQSISPTCIFPKITRLQPDGESASVLIFRGRALFEDSRLLALGRKEKTDLQRLMTNVHKQYALQNGGDPGFVPRANRKLSIATQANHP